MQFVVIILLTFSINAFADSSTLPYCEDLPSPCLSSPSTTPQNEDGTVLPSVHDLSKGQLSREARTLAKTPSPTGSVRVREELFTLRDSMLSYIQQQPASAHTQYLVQRLNSLQVEVRNDPSTCGDYAFNAQYDQLTNRVVVCPLITHMPREAAVALFAHELGHLADPCNYVDSYAFGAQLRRSPPGSQTQRQRLIREIQKCLPNTSPSERLEFERWATGNSRMATQSLNIGPGIPDDLRSQVQALRDCGVVQSSDSDAPTTYEGHPFLKSIQCANSQPGSKATTPLTIEATSRILGPTQTATCARQHSIYECTADHAGAAVLQHHLQSHPQRYSRERKNLFTYFFQTVRCARTPRGYPDGDRRLQIFMQIPQLQEAHGCRQKTPPACSSLTPTPGRQNPATPSSTTIGR